MSSCLAQACASALLAFSLMLGGAQTTAVRAELPPAAAANAAGIIAVPSAYGIVETVERLQKDIAAKGIMFFGVVDQGGLAAVSGVPGIKPSKLLLFGNPPLGTQFLGANQQAGLDWPVRMLVTEEADGSVWLAWSDFTWVARRYAIKGKDAQFKTATMVAASLAAEAAK